ncbi:calcium-binding protein [Ensifer adhaerens]|uniref:calcium-binding protein n=1 Tax=Ensifer adhaerens TaxID=106592 RepID=UPI00384A89F9
MARIVGSYGNDVLKGTAESDRIWGLFGADTIDGGAGDDFVSGGGGRDTLISSSGYDRLDGGADDDQIVLNGTGGAVTGGAGYDGLVVDFSQTSERMVFNGGSGHGYVGDPALAGRHVFFHDIEWLRVLAGSGDDRIAGTASGDNISTGAGNDVVYAGGGNDLITNSGGHDRLNGGAGNDRFVLIGTGSTVSGGSGTDTLAIDLVAAKAPVVFNLQNGHGSIGHQTSGERHIFVTYDGIEKIEVTTGSGNDRILGSTLSDVIQTGGGNDFVDAGVGDDTIIDGLGANRLFGGDGRDQITSTLYSAEIDGGAGQDWLWIKETQRTSDLTVDFSAGGASTGTVISGIEEASLMLGSGNDRVIAGDLTYLVVEAGAGNDHLEGGAGGDALYGEDGNDYIHGGAGNDSIVTGAGDDVAYGGDGMDTLANTGGSDVLDGGAGDDWLQDTFPGGGSLGVASILRGGAGNDTINARYVGEVDGGEGRDLLNLNYGGLPEAMDFDAARGVTHTGLTFTGIEYFNVSSGGYDDVLRGGDDNDTFYASSGNDILEGRGGDDKLTGASENDQLFGGDGADFLDGGSENDLLSGGNGSDVLTGGRGADTFYWSSETSGEVGLDRILDFDGRQGDRIAFSDEAQDTTGIHSYADFLAAARDTADGVFVSFNGSETEGILIEDSSLSVLSESDLVFG